MKKEKREGQKKRFPWWKISLGILALVVIIVMAVTLIINSVVSNQINQALETYLPEGGTLAAAHIGWIGGQVECEGLAINPPKGYGGDPLFSLNSLEVDVDMTSLLGDEIVVEELALKGLSLMLMRDKEGQLNVVELISSISDASGQDVPEPEPSKATGENDDKGEDESTSIPAIRVQSIRFENFFVRLDDKLSGEEWSASLTIDLGINDLQLRDLLHQEILMGKVNLTLSNVNVDQPEGFSQVPLIAIDKIEIETPGYEIGGPRLVVSNILVDNLAASFERDKKGAVNFLKLLETLPGKVEDGNESKQGSGEKIDEPSSGNTLPVICLEQIHMKGGAFVYRDEALTEQPMIFPLSNIQIEAVRLCLFEDNTKADPASASMSFELGQSGGLPTAYFGSVAAIGPVGSGVPLVNSQVRLTGFKLDTLGSLVPKATRTSLGANGFDFDLALALDKKRIKLEAAALSDHNINYDEIYIQGPLNDPKIEMGILDGIYGRVSDGLVNFGASGLGAGAGIAKGGVGAAKEVGSGAIAVGKNIVENLFKAGAGLFSLDQKQVQEGLVGSTKGSADLTLNSVEGAGSKAGEVLNGSVSKLKGDAALKAWDKGIPSRFKTVMKQARKKLMKMPYPPVTN
jgi:uncharacterized protein involved in outer membrane biogenesis